MWHGRLRVAFFENPDHLYWPNITILITQREQRRELTMFPRSIRTFSLTTVYVYHVFSTLLS